MKKHLLILVAALLMLLPVSVKAAQGDNCANPYVYSVSGTNALISGTHWYSIKISDAIAFLDDQDFRLKLVNNATTTAHITVSIYFGCDESAFATETKSVSAGGEWTSNSRLTNGQLRRFGMAYTYVYAKVTADIEIEAITVPTEPQPVQPENEECLNATVIEEGIDYPIPANAVTWFTYTFDGNERFSAVFTPATAGAVFSKIVSLYDDCSSAPTIQRVTRENSVDREAYPPAGQYWASLEVGSVGGSVRFTRHTPVTPLECAGAEEISAGTINQTEMQKAYFFVPEGLSTAEFTLADGQQLVVKEGVCGSTLHDLTADVQTAPAGKKTIQLPALESGHAYFFFITGAGEFVFAAPGSSCADAEYITPTTDPIPMSKGKHWYAVNVDELLDFLDSHAPNKDLKIKLQNMSNSSASVKAILYENDCAHLLYGPQSRSLSAGQAWTPNARVTNGILQTYSGSNIYIYVEAKANMELTLLPTEAASAANPDCENATEIVDGTTYNLPADQAVWFKYNFDGCHYITAEFQPVEDPAHVVTKSVELYKNCSEAAIITRTTTSNEYSRKAVPPAGTYYAKVTSLAEAGIVTFRLVEDNSSICSCAITLVPGNTYTNPAARTAYVYVPEAAGKAEFTLLPSQSIEVKEGLCGQGETLRTVTVTRTSTSASFDMQVLPAGHAYYVFIEGAADFKFGAAGADCNDPIAIDVHDGVAFDVEAGDHWYSVDIDATINNIGAGSGLKFHIRNSASSKATITATIFDDCAGSIFAGPETKGVAANSTWHPNMTITGSTLNRNAGKIFRIHVISTESVSVTPEVIATQPADPDCEAAPEIQEGMVYDLVADQPAWFKYTADGCHYVNAVYVAEDPTHTAVSKTVEIYTACNEPYTITRTRTTNEYTRQAVPPAGEYYAKVISHGENGSLTFSIHTSDSECACATAITRGETKTNPAARTPYVYMPAAAEDVVITLADGQQVELKEGVCGNGETLNVIAEASVNGNYHAYSLPALAEGHAYYIFVTGAGDFKLGDAGDNCATAIEVTVQANVPFDILAGQHWYSVNVDQVLAALNGQDLKIMTNNANATKAHVTLSIFESCNTADLIIGPESRDIATGEHEYSRRITNSMLSRYAGLDIKLLVDAALGFTVTPLFEAGQDQPNEDCLAAVEIVPGEEYTVLAGKEAWFTYEFSCGTYMNGEFTAADPTLSNVSKDVILSSDCADVVYSTTTTKDSYTRTLVPPAGRYYAMLKPSVDGKMVFSLHNSQEDCACASDIVAGQAYTAAAGTAVYRFTPDAALANAVIEHAAGQQIEVREGICGEPLNDIALTVIDDTHYSVDFAALQTGHSYYIYVTGEGEFQIGNAGDDCASAIELEIQANTPFPILEGQHWYSVNVDRLLAALNGQDLKIKTINNNNAKAGVDLTAYESCNTTRVILGPEHRNIGIGEIEYSRRITNSMLSRYAGFDIKLFVDATLAFDVVPLFEPAQDQPNEDCLEAIDIVDGEEYELLAGKQAWFKHDFTCSEYYTAEFIASDPTLSNVSKNVIISSDCADVVYNTTTTKDVSTRTIVPPAGIYYAMIQPEADGKIIFTRHISGADCACAEEIFAGQTYTAASGTTVYRFAPDAAMSGKVIEHAAGQQIEVKEGLCGETLNDVALTVVDDTHYSVDFAALNSGHSYYVYVTGAGDFQIGDAGDDCETAQPLDIYPGNPISLEAGEHWYNINVDQVLEQLQDLNDPTGMTGSDLKIEVHNGNSTAAHVTVTIYENCEGTEFYPEQSKTIGAGKTWKPNTRITYGILLGYRGSNFKLKVVSDLDVDLTPQATDGAARVNPLCRAATEIVPGVAYQLVANKTCWFKYHYPCGKYLTADYQAEEPTHTAVRKLVELYESCNTDPVISRHSTENHYDRTYLPPVLAEGEYYYAMIQSDENGIITFTLNDAEEAPCNCAEELPVATPTSINGTTTYRYQPENKQLVTIILDNGQSVKVEEGVCGGTLHTIFESDQTGSVVLPELQPAHLYFVTIFNGGEFEIQLNGGDCEHAYEAIDGAQYPVLNGIPAWFKFESDADKILRADYLNALVAGANKHVVLYYGNCDNMSLIYEGNTRTDVYDRDYVAPAGTYYAMVTVDTDADVQFHVDDTSIPCAHAEQLSTSTVYMNNGEQWYVLYAENNYDNFTIHFDNAATVSVYEGICGENTEHYSWKVIEENVAVPANSDHTWTLPANTVYAHHYYFKVIEDGTFTVMAGNECATAYDLQNSDIMYHIAAGETVWFTNTFPGDNTVELTFTGTGADMHKVGMAYYNCTDVENNEPQIVRNLDGNHYDRGYIVPAETYVASITADEDVDVFFHFYVPGAPCANAQEVNYGDQPAAQEAWYKFVGDNDLDMYAVNGEATVSVYKTICGSNIQQHTEAILEHLNIADGGFGHAFTPQNLTLGYAYYLVVEAGQVELVDGTDCAKPIEIVNGEKYQTTPEVERFYVRDYSGPTMAQASFYNLDGTANATATKTVNVYDDCTRAPIVTKTSTVAEKTINYEIPTGRWPAGLSATEAGYAVFNIESSDLPCAEATEIALDTDYPETGWYKLPADAEYPAMIVKTDGDFDMHKGICGAGTSYFHFIESHSGDKVYAITPFEEVPGVDGHYYFNFTNGSNIRFEIYAPDSTVVDTLCAGGEREVAGEMIFINEDFIEDRVLQSQIPGIVADSTVHYQYIVYKSPLMPQVEVERNQSVGVPMLLPELDVRPAEADTAEVAHKYWEVIFDPNNGNTTWLPYDSTEVVALSAEVRPVIEDACGARIEGGVQFVRFEKYHAEGIAYDTICAGENITLYDGQTRRVDADESYQQTFDYDKFNLGDMRYADTTITYVTTVYKLPAVPAVTIPDVTMTVGESLDAYLGTVDLTAPAQANPDDMPLSDGVWEITTDGTNFTDLDLANPIYDLEVSVRIRYNTMVCDEVLYTGPKALTVNRQMSEENVEDTYCPGAEIELGDGTTHTVTAEETFDYVTYEDLNTQGDELIEVTTHYTVHVYVAPTLNVTPADIVLTAGDDIRAAFGNVELVEDADYPMPITAQYWEASYDGGDWTAIDPDVETPVYSLDVKLRYVVEGECDLRLVSDEETIEVVKKITEIYADAMVLCPGAEVTLNSGDVHVVTADEVYTDIKPIDEFNVGRTDLSEEHTIYEFHVYVEPMLNVTPADIVLTAGDDIRAAFGNVELVEDADYPMPITGQYWEASYDGGDWTAIDPDVETPVYSLDVKLRYIVEGECDLRLVSDEETIEVVKKITEIYADAMVLCPGAEVTLNSGDVHVVTADEVYTDIKPIDEFNVGRTDLSEEHTIYEFHVYVEPTLNVTPADIVLTAGDDIRAAFGNVELVEDADYPMPVTGQYWEASYDGGDWTAIDPDVETPVYSLDVKLRYVVEGECDLRLVSDEETIEVVKKITEIYADAMVLCQGAEVTLNSGDVHVVTADEVYTDIKPIDEFNVGRTDLSEEHTIYEFHVYVAPTLSVAPADIALTAGDDITRAFGLPEVTEDADYPMPITNQYWQINYDGQGWIDYNESDDNRIFASNVQLRYIVEGECDLHLVSDIIYYNVALYRDEVSMPENDEVYCVGEQITLADGSNYIVNNDAQFSQTVPFDYFELGQEPYYAERKYNYDLHVYNAPTITLSNVPVSITAGDVILDHLPTVEVTEAQSNPVGLGEQYWIISKDGSEFGDVTEDPILAHVLQLKYIVETDCGINIESAPVAISVNKYVVEVDYKDTVCVGAQIVLNDEEHTIKTITEDWRADMTAPFYGKFGTVLDPNHEYADSIVHYDIRVYRDPQLPVVTLPVANLTAGDAFEAPEITLPVSELDEKTITSAEFQISIDGAEFEAYDNTAIVGAHADFRVAYTTSCDDVLYANVGAINIDKYHGEGAEEATLCPGETYQFIDGSSEEITADVVKVVTTDYAKFGQGTELFADTTVTYTLTVLKDPILPNVDLGVDRITAGDEITLPAIEIRAAEADTVAVANTYWTIRKDYGTAENYNGEPIVAHNAILQYFVETECGTVIDGQEFAILVDKYIEESTVEETVCAGHQYLTPSGQLVTVTTSAQFDDVLPFDKFNVGSTEFAEQITHYIITVYSMPEFSLNDVLTGICGEALELPEPSYTAGEDIAEIASIVWQIRSNDNGAYADYNGAPVYGTEAVVRYVATTSCGTTYTSDPMTVVLEVPIYTADDVEIGVEKYGWLLLINKTAVEATINAEIEESWIYWYKVVGEVDYDSHETNDEFLGNGFYYTTDHTLTGTGQYYAVIDVPASGGACGSMFRSQIFLFNTERQQIRLQSTMLTRDDDVTVLNLDTESETTVRVVDMTGQTIYQTRTIGTDVLTLPAQQSGYYMVHVNGGINRATLKFVVK